MNIIPSPEAFVTQFVCIHGIPNSKLTVQETELLSKTFSKVYKLLKITKRNTFLFYPLSNGSSERSHRI